jgi:hypothetical protein
LALLSAEQSCSKYHYEEQTLRKMITVEILVDKLKADVDETKGNLHDTLAYITTERTESTKMLKQMTSRIVDIENILKDLKDEKGKVCHVLFLIMETHYICSISFNININRSGGRSC